MIKKLCWILGCVLFFSNSPIAGGFLHHVEHRGDELTYGYYVPETVTAEPDAIILVPDLEDPGESMIDSKWLALSEETGRPIIAPPLLIGDREPRKMLSEGHLRAIFKQFSEKGIHIQHLYMAGFSAGAEFVRRYSLNHSNWVKKCAIGVSSEDKPVDRSSPVKFFYGIVASGEEDYQQQVDMFAKQEEKYGVFVERKIYPYTGQIYTAEMEDDFIRFLTD